MNKNDLEVTNQSIELIQLDNWINIKYSDEMN